MSEAGDNAPARVSEIAEPEVLDLLARLVEKSLVVYEEDQQGQGRYRLQETMTQYARGRLREAGAEVTTSERHARYYLQLAENCVGRLRTADEAHALEDLSEETDNLRAGMDRAAESGSGELCARLALALYRLLYRRGLWEEARARLESALGALAGQPVGAAALEAAIHSNLASLAHERGDLTTARREGEAGLALWEDLGDARGTLEALNALALLAMDEGALDSARERFEAALRLVPDADPAWRGIVLHNLARLASRSGDAERARQLYEEALRYRRAAGDRQGEADTLGALGAIAHREEDLALARRLYDESLELYRAAGYPYGIAVTLNNLGELNEVVGDLPNAIACFARSEELFRDLGATLRAVPGGHLKRLEESLGPERWSQLSAEAESLSWRERIGKA